MPPELQAKIQKTIKNGGSKQLANPKAMVYQYKAKINSCGQGSGRLLRSIEI
jgi:hypothetical protein